MNLSPHFTLEELTYSSTAKAKKINNIPNEAEKLNLKLLCNSCLEKVRTLIGKPIKVTSGFRSLALNKAVGGSTTSSHAKGLACDFTVAGMTTTEIVNKIRKSDIKFTQLIEEHSGNSHWTHISFVPNNLKCEVLLYKNGNYTKI